MHPFRSGAFGWLRDLPDPRDYGPDHPNVSALCSDLKSRPATAARQADLSEFFPEVGVEVGQDAGASGSCADLTAYFERRSRGESAEASSLFLYQVARRLSRRTGGGGTDLRTTLKALARFGVPPERYWPYDPARLDDEPEPFLYAFGREYQPLVYVRLDPIGLDPRRVLRGVKAHLAAGFAVVFGFSTFESRTTEPDIPRPTRFDAVIGGSTAVAVGFDDTRRIRSTKGALRVRMTWGPSWGEAGYGWLPYAYVEEGLAADFWTLLRPDWLGSGEFCSPAR